MKQALTDKDFLWITHTHKAIPESEQDSLRDSKHKGIWKHSSLCQERGSHWFCPNYLVYLIYWHDHKNPDCTWPFSFILSSYWLNCFITQHFLTVIHFPLPRFCLRSVSINFYNGAVSMNLWEYRILPLRLCKTVYLTLGFTSAQCLKSVWTTSSCKDQRAPIKREKTSS